MDDYISQCILYPIIYLANFSLTFHLMCSQFTNIGSSFFFIVLDELCMVSVQFVVCVMFVLTLMRMWCVCCVCGLCAICGVCTVCVVWAVYTVCDACLRYKYCMGCVYCVCSVYCMCSVRKVWGVSADYDVLSMNEKF